MFTVGLDLGGTKTLGALVDGQGQVIEEARRPTPDDGDELVEALAALVDDLRGDRSVAAVGVGAAGMIAVDGSVTYGPNVGAFRDGFPLRSRMEERLAMPVGVDNDANAAAWAEVQHGAAAGHDDALVITLGTGIGGGIVLDGALYRGARGYAAEIGHFQVQGDGPICACGQPGHWEAIASGPALGRMAREAVERGGAPAVLAAAGGQVDQVEGEHVGVAAAGGDEAALRILDAFADNVAIGLAGLANILDPSIIVVGGGLIALGDLLLDRLRGSFAGRIGAPDLRPPIDIVAAALGERAGAIGAAALARERSLG